MIEKTLYDSIILRKLKSCKIKLNTKCQLVTQEYLKSVEMGGHMRENFKRNVVMLLAVISIAISGCSNDNELRTSANEIVDSINNNDMDALQKIIIGEDDLSYDEELSDFFDTENEEDSSSESGIISEIVAQDSIKLKKINDSTIEYEIKTPKLENIFQDALDQNLEDGEIEDYLREYIRNADKEKIDIEVSYTYVDGVFEADYETEEFVNALTGNMIKSYQELVQQMIQEMSTEVD